VKKVNLVRIKSKSYAKVQTALFEELTLGIDNSMLSESQDEYVKSKSVLNLTFFIRHKADVLMSHGVADKNYMLIRDKKDGSRLVNSFKYVLVPGEWLKQKLLKDTDITLQADQIKIIGWPRLNSLKRLKRKWRISRVLNILRNRFNGGKKIVLWAPTHDFRKRGVEQKSTSSYPDLLEFVPKLTEEFRFFTSLHPRNRECKRPTDDILVRSDVVISDVGTIVYEAWALGIPVVFPRWILKDRIIEFTPGSAEAYIFENNIGYHASSFEEMLELISNPRLQVEKDVKKFLDLYLEQKPKFNLTDLC
jgi:CDP-glycerol glycerophosphotransferase (TagB/SpsB family)